MDVRDDFKVHSMAAMRMKKGRPAKPPVAEVKETRVDTRIWEAAMREAEGDILRILVVKPTMVVVVEDREDLPRARLVDWEARAV